MHKKTTSIILRYITLMFTVSAGIASIIASGGGGGGGDYVPPIITGNVSGKCIDMITGLGEYNVGATLHRPLTADKSSSLAELQQLTLPTSEVVDSTTTLSDGSYQFTGVPIDDNYFISYAKTGFLDEGYFEVAVEQDTTEVLEPVPLLETRFDTSSGIISGSVTDAETEDPIQFAIISVREGINNRTGTKIQDVTTDEKGNYTIEGLDAGSYTLEASRSTYQTAYFDALVLDADSDSTTDDITIVGTIALVPEDLASSTFSISGTVFAAYDIDGDAGPPFVLGAASIRLRKGINTTVGSVLADGFTDSSGLYSLSNVLTGQYTLEGTLEGAFNPGYIDLTLASDLVNHNVTLMPIVSVESEQITAVLTWGTTTDLDDMLFEVDPMLVRFTGLNDDQDGFGPETTLLGVVDIDKRYEYFVRDYYGTLLSGSKAQVRVYRGNNLIFTFNPPLNDPDIENAVDWYVFSIDGNRIEPVNDLGPSINISDTQAYENLYMVFDVSLNFFSTNEIELNMATIDGTAIADDDYLSSNFEYSIDGGGSWILADGINSTIVKIPVGQSSIKVRISMFCDDFFGEGSETFKLRVTEVISGSVGNFTDTGTGTILDTVCGLQ